MLYPCALKSPASFTLFGTTCNDLLIYLLVCEYAGTGKPQACVWRSEDNSGFCSFLTLVWTVNGTQVISGYVICHVSYVQNKNSGLHFNHLLYVLEGCLRKGCHIVRALCHMMADLSEFSRNPEFPCLYQNHTCNLALWRKAFLWTDHQGEEVLPLFFLRPYQPSAWKHCLSGQDESPTCTPKDSSGQEWKWDANRRWYY